MAFDQMKMLNDLRKAQKELKKQQIIAAAGGEDDDPAVEVTINGELKVENISINPDYVDLEDIEELEGWLEAATPDGRHEHPWDVEGKRERWHNRYCRPHCRP